MDQSPSNLNPVSPIANLNKQNTNLPSNPMAAANQSFAQNQKPKRKINFLKISLIIGAAAAIISSVFYIIKTNLRLAFPKHQEKSYSLNQKTPSPTNASQTLKQNTASKYQTDSDKDGLPDFVETAIGSNPQANECLLQTGCGNVAEIDKRTVNVLFILDSSGSMAGNVAGGQKMAIAKQAIKKYIDQLPENINAGLMVYGHKGSNSSADKAVSCAGIETLYPIQKVNKNIFKAKIDSFSPTGWTPIAGSLSQAKSAFANMEGNINKIVLVSDGIETCGGQPCAIAKELKKSGIEALIDVIGFDVNQAAKNQLQCISQATGGKYFDAKTAQEFNDVFKKLGKEAKNLSEASGCLAEKLGDYLKCLMDQFNKALSYLSSYCNQLKNSGKNQEASYCFQAVNNLSKKNADMIRQSTQYTKQQTQKLINKNKSLY